ncbi:MAG TPA: 2-oxo-4-hydroxy-4-carboxy-5-ureidoimidazoline decarboxylase [Geminicoccus sp.]|jgi:2-oxo-4-hydroxy-4-carboxy-5-ureidoimidazoline decarboxylase|uniref:2-oxo-4-hydroxy-4-carboxy-5-ureidoimidazoline decarboxylase n=1 Tax=Geminicoccus sp. TaxID=2024832 RepID=UPI002E31294C|nr:2-oxo-4-hydroxy-4-carboxy-5-ureidoimidazoline decarboxylase [Geminicoccus sp.]HEX2525643.1 2-oxo-4-hydroxy-4-carboxy-5-ureidoimidazoline decarboxylase [Geminicoccus sp.]
MPTMADVDRMDRTSFVGRFGGIFEHSPWVAERAWDHRPFSTLQNLHAAMVQVVGDAAAGEQDDLIRAHPDLAGRAARAGDLTADSAREQASAGLDRLSEEEFERFHALNDAYRTKFGFPFIIAVRGAGKDAILQGFEQRLANDLDVERRTALEQIARIAWFRLSDLVPG